jgi:ABC-type antimicrobial peptide transport system permease subunit
VAQRAPEIGIRMALGAQRGRVLRLILRDGVRVAAIGVAAGILLALVATRGLGSTLYGVAPWDPITFVAIALLLVLVACAASWLPARRAASVDPAIALRAE